MSPVIYTSPTPHRCELPYVTRPQPQIHLVPAHPEGTLWKCDDCGAVWRVEGRQSEEDRRAGLTALSTEWVRIVTGLEDDLPDDMVERAAEALTTAMHASYEDGWMSGPLSDYTIDGHYDMVTATRAALNAALSPGEPQS